MNIGTRWMAAIAGLGCLVEVAPAQAEAPGVYYAWRSVNISVNRCLTQATAALNGQSLQAVASEGNSVSGRTEDATALFVCLDEGEATTVMVVVSSTNDETAFNLREALKTAF
jgi:hypothetical protein